MSEHIVGCVSSDIISVADGRDIYIHDPCSMPSSHLHIHISGEMCHIDRSLWSRVDMYGFLLMILRCSSIDEVYRDGDCHELVLSM